MRKNKLTANRPVRFSEDGEIAYIRVASGETVIVDRKAYERLMEQGVSPNWTRVIDRHGNAYINVWHREFRNNVPVARLITDARKRVVISYRNGNHYDLRRSNLIFRKGPTRRDTSSAANHA